MEKPNKKLVLENGKVFYGTSFGANIDAVGEIVFNTGMSRYQEVVSDLGYSGQMIVMSYPIIGSYGITDEDYESKSLGLKALIVREYNDNPSNFRYTKTLAELLEENNVPGIQGIDTRELIGVLRKEGTMFAALVDASMPDEDAVKLTQTAVYPTNIALRSGCKKRWYSRTPNHQYNVVAIDNGIKFQMIRALNHIKCNVIMVPATITAEEIFALKPNGVFVSNGPGNPSDCKQEIQLVKKLIGKLPIMGVGLGMQILALCKGAETIKLKCGHHGANHPVKNMITGKVETVVQNHNYVITEQSLEKARLTLTYKNLLDGTVEGIEDDKNKMYGIQFYGDNKHFEKFKELMDEEK